MTTDKKIYAAALFAALAASANAKIYFQENFNDADWESRWTVPTEWKSPEELGAWSWTEGKYGVDHGIQTSEDARFYGISAPLDSTFTNVDKDLVLQFSVKNEQNLDCGGAYIKLLGDMDQAKFGGSTPYQIMFGPDVCGPVNRKTHVILNYPPKQQDLLIKKEVPLESDRLSHLYTLHIKKDNTFDVYIDYKNVRSGSLETEFDFLLPRTIPDPNVSKPADWVDADIIADPEDIKPEGWDDIPREIPDPDATKPEDWDEEEDGEWEAPLIQNPEYKGPWKPKMIENPAYKGEWEHPVIPNPEFVEDPNLYQRCTDCKYIGFELWQVTTGTIFDDILVADNLEEAKKVADETFFKKQPLEKEKWDAIIEEQRLADEEARAAAAAADASSSEEDAFIADEHEEL